MKTLTIDSVLACPSLPSLPTVAMRVLELSKTEDASIDEIAEVVQNDPALTAKILRTVNSSYYALSAPCSTIARALTYMGLSSVKSLVLGFSLRAVTGSDGGFDLTTYWRRCLYSAAAARKLAAMTSACDPDEAFAAALMQDIGMLAMHAVDVAAYGRVVASAHGDHRRLARIEQDAYGFDHTAAGAALAERWCLPEGLCECIRHHHDAEGDAYRAMVQVVSAGTEVAIAVALPNPGSAITQLGQRCLMWFELDSDQVDQLMRDVAEQVEQLSDLFDVTTGDGVDINWILAQAEEASVVHQLAIQRETESLRKSNDELARKALTDGLTNVANRARFDEELAMRFEQARSFDASLGVIIGDIDHFKSVNDTYGHMVGDTALVEVARRLQQGVRGADLVCRYGGEEFAVILPGASLKDVAMIAERLREAVQAQPIRLDPESAGTDSIVITMSLGAAVFEASTASVLSSPERLVLASDRALYAAKDGGRNCVRVFRIERAAA